MIQPAAASVTAPKVMDVEPSGKKQKRSYKRKPLEMFNAIKEAICNIIRDDSTITKKELAEKIDPDNPPNLSREELKTWTDKCYEEAKRQSNFEKRQTTVEFQRNHRKSHIKKSDD